MNRLTKAFPSLLVACRVFFAPRNESPPIFQRFTQPALTGQPIIGRILIGVCLGEAMREVFTSLMAGVLFIHTMFGCCFQPAHSYGFEYTAAHINQPVTCCKHCRDSGDTLPHHSPPKNQAECQGVCTYLVPSKTQVDNTQAIAVLDLVAVVSILTDAQVGSASRWELANSNDEIEPPLRLHLLLQTLLI